MTDIGPSAARSAVDVGGFVGVTVGVVCVIRGLLRCALVARCLAVACGGLAVVRGIPAVVRGILAVEHGAHPVACGLVVLVFVRAAVIGVGEFSTDAGADVAPDSRLIALGGAAIAVGGGAIVRVSVLSGH